VRDPRERLRHILEAIAQIKRYASRGRQAFEGDELIQSWVVHRLQIIGEAARALPQAVRDRAPDIPWSEMVGMRHVLVHDYFGVDTEMVWGVVERGLPPLKQKIEALLAALERDPAA